MLTVPLHCTERQRVLWCGLGQPNKMACGLLVGPRNLGDPRTEG